MFGGRYSIIRSQCAKNQLIFTEFHSRNHQRKIWKVIAVLQKKRKHGAKCHKNLEQMERNWIILLISNCIQFLMKCSVQRVLLYRVSQLFYYWANQLVNWFIDNYTTLYSSTHCHLAYFVVHILSKVEFI